MNVRRKRFNWIIAAAVVSAIHGLVGFTARADAQTVASLIAAGRRPAESRLRGTTILRTRNYSSGWLQRCKRSPTWRAGTSTYPSVGEPSYSAEPSSAPGICKMPCRLRGRRPVPDR